MNTWWRVVLVSGLVFALAPQATTQNQRPLDIYYVDVEGGAATLFVSPSGESLLVDSGHPGTIDAERIVAAAKAAGLKQIDYLVTSHHHLDHVGGATELNARIPIRHFVDHGLPTAQELKDNEALYQAYLKVRAQGRHVPVKPGDKIPIAGLDVQVVSSGGELVTAPLAGAGAPNPLCRDFAAKAETPLMGGENGRSVGLVVRSGNFRTIVLGDLTWNKEHDLVCPNNLLGTVDVYLTTHHGLNISGPQVIVHALGPRVAVMNNGPTKGGAPDAWRIVRDSPGLEDLWQGHYSVKAGRDHNAPEQFIANFDETGSTCPAHRIKVSASNDGSFVVTNGRNGFSKTYTRRTESRRID